jgi:hypothetical protein
VLVYVITMLVMPMPVVDVVHVITVLDRFVSVAFVVLTLMVRMDVFLGVPFAVV